MQTGVKKKSRLHFIFPFLFLETMNSFTFSHDITIEDFFSFGSPNDASNHIFLILKTYIGNCGLNGMIPNVEAALNQRVLSDKKYKNEQSFYIKWNCFDNLAEESSTYGEQWCL